MKDLLIHKGAGKFFISRFNTQQFKLQINMLLYNWITEFLDHQDLHKELVYLLNFLNRNDYFYEP